MDAGGRATQGAVAEGQGEGINDMNTVQPPLTPTLSRRERESQGGAKFILLGG